MTTVEQIAAAVRRLLNQERARLWKWFTEYDGAAWDRQLEQDVRKGDWTRWPGTP